MSRSLRSSSTTLQKAKVDYSNSCLSSDSETQKKPKKKKTKTADENDTTHTGKKRRKTLTEEQKAKKNQKKREQRAIAKMQEDFVPDGIPMPQYIDRTKPTSFGGYAPGYPKGKN